jgi:hypothetical protein
MVHARIVGAATVVALLLAGCSSASSDGSPGETAGEDSGSHATVDAGHATRGADASGGHDASAERDAGASDARKADTGSHDARSDDAGGADSAGPSEDAGVDAGVDGGCSVGGVAGQCVTVAACSAMTGYSSTPGYCPGPANIECCTDAPSTADNPPPPAGWVLMQQSAVTSQMTAWAVMILDDPTDYPMFSTTMMTFGTQEVLAIVQWHPPDFQNTVVHRGVTLYVPS